MADTTFSVDLETLLEAGCHFGHQARRWNPRMADYIFTEKDGVHIFDLGMTASQLEKACQYLFETAKAGKTAVFVGTKRQAQEMTKVQAVDAGANYIVNRWPGGLITNWEQVGKSIQKLNTLKTEKEQGLYATKYTKRENVLIDREIARLERFFGGVADLKRIPDVLVITDINKEIVAVKEAQARGVFIIAIADSNTAPDLVDIAIPANDDAVSSLQLLIERMANAFKQGKEATRSAAKAEESVTEEKKGE